MIEATALAFGEKPLGRHTAAGTSLLWCHSPTLGGAVSWGRPSAEDTEAVMRIFASAIEAMAPSFDLVLDTRRIEHIGPEALDAFVTWARRHLGLLQRIRMQAVILAEGPIGYMLSGLRPWLGDTHPLRLFTDGSEAFELVAPGFGRTLLAELDQRVEVVSGVSAELRALRDVLRERAGDLSIEDAAGMLGTSTRSLQRLLAGHGRSFRAEQQEARFVAACELLTTSNAKLQAIASQLGVTERRLSQMFQERLGISPAEYRVRHGSKP